jgi:glycosyltransferase involved in cell wall biosynthesis
MNIVHLVSAGVIGGAEKIALQLAAHQNKTGNTVEIWFLFNGGPIKAQAEILGLKTRFCGLRSGLDILGAVKLHRLLSGHHPDVIHVHAFTIGFLVGLLKRKQAVVLLHEHGDIFSNNNLRRHLYNMILRRVVHLADAYIAVSEATRRILVKTLLIENKAIRTIPNGVDVSLFACEKKVTRIKSEMGIPESSLIIGTVGRLVKEKGIDNYLRAAALIRKKLPDVRFVVVGDGPCRHELSAMVADLGLGDSVSLLGMRDDVPELLTTFDLFLLTSNRESFGISLVEAMASGVPVLAFSVDGVPEIVDERCGVLLSPGDVEGLAEQAIALLLNEDRRHILAAACRVQAEKFSIQTASRQVYQLYTELMAARTPNNRLI